MDSTSSKDTLAYDQLNRLTSINGGAKGKYYYDGEGKRVRKDYAGHKTVYLYDQWGNLIAEVDTTGAFICDYVWASGRLVAKIYLETSIPGPSSIGGAEGMSGGGPPPQLKEYIYYYHLDHLGTPLALTGKNQAIAWSADYLPFGEIYNELIVSPTNEIRFPGQYHDRETGLYYNWHRYYKPTLGKYYQADPLTLEDFKRADLLENLKSVPQEFNKYSYVSNNPTLYVDPMGLMGHCDKCVQDWAVCYTRCINTLAPGFTEFFIGSQITVNLPYRMHVKPIGEKIIFRFKPHGIIRFFPRTWGFLARLSQKLRPVQAVVFSYVAGASYGCMIQCAIDRCSY